MFLLAQAAGGFDLTSLLPILAVGAIFWFLVIRPQRKRQHERDAMLQEVGVGNEVVTIGGLFGQVEALDDNWVDLLVGEDVVLRFARSAIGRIATDEDQHTIEAFATGESLLDDDLDDPDDDLDDDELVESDDPDGADTWPTQDADATDGERTDG